MPWREDVIVLAGNAGGIVPVDSDLHFWGPAASTGIALVAIPARASEVALDLPAGACISDVAVGTYVLGAAS
jgi:hypothetical protein